MSINAYAIALQWYQDQGIDEALDDAPVNHCALKAVETPVIASSSPPPMPPMQQMPQSHSQLLSEAMNSAPTAQSVSLGKADAYAKALECTKSATTLDELKIAMASFDGLSLSKTASNMVFSGGDPSADIMVILEAPNKDDDRAGTALNGEEGAFFTRMFKAIDKDAQSDLYIGYLTPWRPPGGRSLSPAEIEVNSVFIQKHIAIKKPKMIVFMGATAAKTLLDKSESLSRLRGKFHDYSAENSSSIPAIVTYPAATLLGAPAQKRAAWADLLMIKAKLADL